MNVYNINFKLNSISTVLRKNIVNIANIKSSLDNRLFD